MKIDINKKYRTADAKWPVTIVSTDGPFPGFPVVGYAHSSGALLLCHWSSQGGYPSNTNLDLVEIRQPREFWVNVYDNMGYAIHSTAEQAEAGRSGVKSAKVIRVREIID